MIFEVIISLNQSLMLPCDNKECLTVIQNVCFGLLCFERASTIFASEYLSRSKQCAGHFVFMIKVDEWYCSILGPAVKKSWCCTSKPWAVFRAFCSLGHQKPSDRTNANDAGCISVTRSVERRWTLHFSPRLPHSDPKRKQIMWIH